MKKNAVYWWEDAPLAALDRRPVAPTADVVIVGAGYTGLGAAIRLARAGRSVQVFDKQHPGEGASTRNGGITSGNLRPSHTELNGGEQPPATRHLLAHVPVAPAGEGASEAADRDTIFDPSLPPAMSAGQRVK